MNEESQKIVLTSAQQAAGLAGHIAADAAGPGGSIVTAKVVKPGWKSTEFWTVLLLPVGLHLLTAATHLPAPWGIMAGAVASGLYALSRGQAKS